MSKPIRKYTSNGAEVSIIEELSNGDLLCKYYMTGVRGDEEYEYIGSCFYIIKKEDIFDKPPTTKIKKDIEVLQNQILELKRQKCELTTDFNKTKYEYDIRLDKLKKFDALKHLEEYLDGKITHFVIIPDYSMPEIRDFAAAMQDDDNRRYCREYKLLTLYGNSNGDLQWKINRYSEGSGGWSAHVFPCLSYESALIEIQKHIKERIEKTKANPRQDIVNCAEKYKVEVPLEYINQLKYNLRQQKQKRFQELQPELAVLTAWLSEN